MSIATTRRLGDRIAALYGPGLWTLSGFVLYILGGLGSLLAIAWLESFVIGPLLLAPRGIDTGAGTLGLSVRNGLHAIAWGLLVVAIAAPLGRRLVAGIRFTAAGWITLAVGLGIAAVVTMLGAEFVRARYGVYDPEYQGLSFFVGPAVVAVALATWAALAVPGDGVLVPGAAVLTATVGLAMSLLPSVPGASDGLRAESMPLVGAFVVALGYGVVAALLIVRRLVRPAA